MTWINPWSVPALIAATLVLGVAVYLAVRWRRAPAALRAMGAVAGVCFTAGLLVGVWAFHLAGSKVWDGLPSPFGSSGSRASGTTGSVSASEVGRAIVETDEKRVGDFMHPTSAKAVGLCNLTDESTRVIRDLGPPDPPGEREKKVPESYSLLCRGAYLARHAIGKDMDHGPHEDSVALSDVADFCDGGTIDKSSDLCVRAYGARGVGMK